MYQFHAISEQSLYAPLMEQQQLGINFMPFPDRHWWNNRMKQDAAGTVKTSLIIELYLIRSSLEHMMTNAKCTIIKQQIRAGLHTAAGDMDMMYKFHDCSILSYWWKNSSSRWWPVMSKAICQRMEGNRLHTLVGDIKCMIVIQYKKYRALPKEKNDHDVPDITRSLLNKWTLYKT